MDYIFFHVVCRSVQPANMVSIGKSSTQPIFILLKDDEMNQNLTFDNYSGRQNA